MINNRRRVTKHEIVLIYCLFNDADSSYGFTALQGIMINEYHAYKVLEGHSRCLIWVLCRHLLQEMRTAKLKPDEKSRCSDRYKTGTSQIHALSRQCLRQVAGWKEDKDR
jgi:ribosomal protein S14